MPPRKPPIRKRRPARKKVSKSTKKTTKKVSKRKKKSAPKSARRTPGKPFEKGGDTRQGRGPKKGAPNAGRPSNELVQQCQAIGLKTVLPRIVAYLKKKGAGPGDAGWRWAADLMLDRGFGKATTPVEFKPPLDDEERANMMHRFLEIARERAANDG